jgi:hypothetical protein
MSLEEPSFPPPNSTTITLHFNTPYDGAEVRQDCEFRRPGILEGPEVSEWLTTLIKEHGDETLDATVELFYVLPDMKLERYELTITTESSNFYN